MKQMLTLFSMTLVLIGGSLINTKSASSQSYGGCVDRRGIPVASILNYNINDVAVAALGPGGQPVIYYNPGVLAMMDEATRRFFYVHECGHHALGHTLGAGHPLTQEQEADCFAIITLVRSGEFDADDVKEVQEAIRQFGRGDWTHLPGPQRAINLRRCLSPSDIDTDSNEDEDEDEEPAPRRSSGYPLPRQPGKREGGVISDPKAEEFLDTDHEVDFDSNPDNPYARYVFTVRNTGSQKLKCKVRAMINLKSRESKEIVRRAWNVDEKVFDLKKGEVKTIKGKIQWHGDRNVFPSFGYEVTAMFSN